MNTTKTLSVKLCKNNPDTIYVFGDNLVKTGKGGQAKIRDCTNAFGIPTKRLPSTANKAYFTDAEEERQAIDLAIAQLVYLSRTHTIVFPEDGLGTGRAAMETKSPKLFKYMNDELTKYFNPGSRRTIMEQQVDDDFFATAPHVDVEKPKSTYVKKEGSKTTEFRGVFINTNDNHKDKAYRVAIAQQSNRGGGVFWMTLGFYNDIKTAALHYNVAALGIFLGKAKLNAVNSKECDKEELQGLLKAHTLRVEISRLVANTVKANGEELQYIAK